ncbi:MAG: HIT family protein [bacterium]|nr:HIT family protein [bacterium]
MMSRGIPREENNMIDCLFCSASWDPEPNLLLETPHWQVVLHENQYYLGRCTVVLRRHVSSLAELSVEEWADLKVIIGRLEAVLHDLFEAEPFNWSCLMNGGYRANPPEPHVHFHLWPRYREPVHFGGLTFEDSEFGRHYDPAGRRSLPKEVHGELVTLLRERLEYRGHNI